MENLNWEEITIIVVALLTVAGIIVRKTKTKSDDKAYDFVKSIVDALLLRKK